MNGHPDGGAGKIKQPVDLRYSVSQITCLIPHWRFQGSPTSCESDKGKNVRTSLGDTKILKRQLNSKNGHAVKNQLEAPSLGTPEAGVGATAIANNDEVRHGC
jgi:hypothetical protein